MINVRISRTVKVEGDVAVQLIEDFCEWLDVQGLDLVQKSVTPAPPPDERSYDELAIDFVKSRDMDQ